MPSLMISGTDVVQKLWSLCNVLRDDGMVYHQYMTELTYLLFLKIAAETGAENALPLGYRWKDLTAQQGEEQLGFYRKMLTYLGEDAPSELVRQIFAFPTTVFKHAANLRVVIDGIDSLEWYSAARDDFGDIYEGLLEKNAVEGKSGAGQYFTPRPLIDSIVALVKPSPGEIIQDPAAGTGGFLVSADKFIKARNKAGDAPSTAFYQGVELVKDTHRLCLMNLFLHDMPAKLIHGDALSEDYLRLDDADVIVTNPPFGTKRGRVRPARGDLTFSTNNKQLLFLQHIYNALKRGGRAAVILPDNVLFEEGMGTRIRVDLMEKCNLHTILRLPTGIFYAQGVKTNVFFFTRGKVDTANTREVWIYDLRTNMPTFGKRTPLSRQHFVDFERAFGSDPKACSPRTDEGPEGRFRRFSREEIQKRGNNLDITWLRDESVARYDELLEPVEIAMEITARLQAGLAEMEELTAQLEGNDLEAA
jgi:type I restriction enzyme M protein